MVLGLVLLFCVCALLAGGSFDEMKTDPARASTRILTAEEAVREAEAAADPGDERSAPVALIGALLFVAGALLVSLAVPTRAERRRHAGAEKPPAPNKPVTPAPVEPPRRMPEPDPAPTVVLPVLAPALPPPIHVIRRVGARMLTNPDQSGGATPLLRKQHQT